MFITIPCLSRYKSKTASWIPDTHIDARRLSTLALLYWLLCLWLARIVHEWIGWGRPYAMVRASKKGRATCSIKLRQGRGLVKYQHMN